MNKYYRLLAMLLACALLLGLAPTACADTCYETLKYTFSMEDNGDFAWLGQGMLLPGEEPEDATQNAIFFYISFESGYATVMGRNAAGEPESCMWLEAEPAQLLLASVQVAASYELLAEMMDQCDELVLVLDNGEEAHRIYIASPEDAQVYLQMMQTTLDDVAGSVPQQEPAE